MTMGAVLQDILAELAGPTLLIGKNRQVLFANDAFRRLARLDAEGQPCSAFLAPTIPLETQACCWSVADHYLACNEPALWHLRSAEGACIPVLCVLRDIRIGGQTSVIALSLQAIEDGGAVHDIAAQHFSAMRQTLANDQAFALWLERYLRQQLGIGQLAWLSSGQAAMVANPAPLWRAVAEDIGRAIDSHPSAVRDSGVFDVVIERPRSRAKVVHLFAPGDGVPGPLLAVSATGGGLTAEVVALLRAAVDTVASPRALAVAAGAPRIELLALSTIEREVLNLTCGGRTDKEIARHRAVSVNTVRNQVRTLMLKLGVRKRTQLVALALQAHHDPA
jgi:DNA-binding CsgD family transcriptional regulator